MSGLDDDAYNNACALNAVAENLAKTEGGRQVLAEAKKDPKTARAIAGAAELARARRNR